MSVWRSFAEGGSGEVSKDGVLEGTGLDSVVIVIHEKLGFRVAAVQPFSHGIQDRLFRG